MKKQKSGKFGSLTRAILQAMRENWEAAMGNTGVLYAEVCRILEVNDPSFAPNPGSVDRIGRRHKEYGKSFWRNKQ